MPLVLRARGGRGLGVADPSHRVLRKARVQSRHGWHRLAGPGGLVAAKRQQRLVGVLPRLLLVLILVHTLVLVRMLVLVLMLRICVFLFERICFCFCFR